MVLVSSACGLILKRAEPKKERWKHLGARILQAEQEKSERLDRKEERKRGCG